MMKQGPVIFPDDLQAENWARYGSRVTWWMCVQAAGGWNEALDAVLDDRFPAAYRAEINELVKRDEVVARAHYRLARQLERSDS